jgi:hypothetical protein
MLTHGTQHIFTPKLYQKSLKNGKKGAAMLWGRLMRIKLVTVFRQQINLQLQLCRKDEPMVVPMGGRHFFNIILFSKDCDFYEKKL